MAAVMLLICLPVRDLVRSNCLNLFLCVGVVSFLQSLLKGNRSGEGTGEGGHATVQERLGSLR